MYNYKLDRAGIQSYRRGALLFRMKPRSESIRLRSRDIITLKRVGESREAGVRIPLKNLPAN